MNLADTKLLNQFLNFLYFKLCAFIPALFYKAENRWGKKMSLGNFQGPKKDIYLVASIIL